MFVLLPIVCSVYLDPAVCGRHRITTLWEGVKFVNIEWLKFRAHAKCSRSRSPAYVLSITLARTCPCGKVLKLSSISNWFRLPLFARFSKRVGKFAIRMSDQYTHAVKSTLKLKTVGPSSAGIMKKKKKEKKIEHVVQSEPTETLANVDTKRPNSASSQPSTTKTKAELKFQEMQEKRQTERILKKAEKTHKQRVEEFNKHLDSLSEHYDIPKVSWTK